MKNAIVGVFVVLILGVAGYVASNGGAYNGGEHGKVIADIGDGRAEAKIVQVEEKDDRAKENDKLNALRNKMGSVAKFDVSDDYDRKCSSCHGITGDGPVAGEFSFIPGDDCDFYLNDSVVDVWIVGDRGVVFGFSLRCVPIFCALGKGIFAVFSVDSQSFHGWLDYGKCHGVANSAIPSI